MADAVNRNRIGRAFDRAVLERLADWLAVAVAVTLPWSTSISQILIVALAHRADSDARRRDGAARIAKPGRRAAGAALDAGACRDAVGERALDRAHRRARRLPQAARSFRCCWRSSAAPSAAGCVLYGFLASCVRAADRVRRRLAAAVPRDRRQSPGVPVRDYIAQSSEFLICIFALLAFAFESRASAALDARGRRRAAGACCSSPTS